MKNETGKTNSVMIDIETAGTHPDAVVYSVAIQQFYINTGELHGYTHLFLPVEEQLREGRVMEADTLVWWSKQSLEAQLLLLENRILAEKSGVTMADVREDIDRMLVHVDEIWANDPDFDCTILRNLMGREYPWPFWKHRSVRTMRMLDAEQMHRHTPEVAHDALHDARAQIKDVCAIYSALSMEFPPMAHNKQ